MKLVLMPEEAKNFLLETVNAAFSTAFNEVTFECGYSSIQSVTFEDIPIEATVLEVGVPS
jgi:hypothetical protein